MKKVELFILNYNGADFIAPCISSLLDAIKNSRHSCKLSVIDNQSTDKSVEVIRKQFPDVGIMAMPENRVLCSFNDAAAKSNAEVIFLLNNDIKVDSYFIDPLVNVYEKKEDVFLVTAKSYLFDNSYEGGRSIPVMKFGLFSMICRFPNYEHSINKFGYTFAAGFGAFDRKKFLELGGYDDLYLPGRMEDADLMLRAWKRGWKCYYEPSSTLYHMGAKSFNKRFGERGTMEIAHRNTFLFMWKNMDGLRYWATHFLFLLPRMVWMLLRGHPEFVTGFLKALPKLSLALVKRRQEKALNYQFSICQVISFFSYGN